MRYPKPEKLELIEKKVEIQRKLLENRREKLNLDLIDKRKVEIEEQRILIEKIEELRCLLSEQTIDDQRTILGSEPFMKPVLGGYTRELVIKKIEELVRKL